MIFNKHSNLSGQHAFLSASKYHWVNYDDDKLIAVFRALMAAEKGTRLHALAHEHIELGIKMPRTKKTLDAFINDAIGFKMQSEQILYYSDMVFGTADAISFKDNFLRIHDLKTGTGPTSMTQLLIYAALFCLEYHYKPADIQCELRIYQNDEVIVYEPAVDEIVPIMDKIVRYSKMLQQIKEEEN